MELSFSVYVRKEGYRSPIINVAHTALPTTTPNPVITIRKFVFPLGVHSLLNVRCFQQHILLHTSVTKTNADYHYDTLLRLKHFASASAAAATSRPVEVGELLLSLRCGFANCDAEPNTSDTVSLPLPSHIQKQLTAGSATHFRLELDFIYRKDCLLPLYTDKNWSQSSVSPLLVMDEHKKTHVPVFINPSFLALVSQRYRRELKSQRTTIQFSDIMLSSCIKFLHHVYTDRELSWSEVFSVLQSAEQFDSASVWNRCARFIITDSRRPLEFKLAYVAATVRQADAKWRLITELIASTEDYSQLRHMFATGFEAVTAFRKDDDRQKAVKLYEKRFAGDLPSTPDAFVRQERRFDGTELAGDPHSVGVSIVGVQLKLYVNKGVFEIHNTKPIQVVTPEDREIFEIYLRFVYPDRRTIPMEKLTRLFHFAVSNQLHWFVAVLETCAIRYYSKMASSRGRLTPTALLKLLAVAYEHRLVNLKSMCGFWLQCADEEFWLRLIRKKSCATLVLQFDSFNTEVRQARLLGWAHYDTRLSAGIHITAAAPETQSPMEKQKRSKRKKKTKRSRTSTAPQSPRSAGVAASSHIKTARSTASKASNKNKGKIYKPSNAGKQPI